MPPLSPPAKGSLEWLNYHHLRIFWVIAHRRSLTRAARELHLSQSTLSQQLANLEEWLEQPLFERRGRRLHLTDAGRVALEYADTIFLAGSELLDRFRRGRGERPRLRLGAVGPLSKNLQYDFIEPLLGAHSTHVTVVSGSLEGLERQLLDQDLDLVLSNIPLRSDQSRDIFNHLLGETPVYIAGTLQVPRAHRPFAEWLPSVPLFLPTHQSHVRADFEALLAEKGIEANVVAEVDDMALLRLLAMSGHGLALVSAIVLERELNSGLLQTVHRVHGLTERFYAITRRRRFGNADLEQVVSSFRQRLLSIG